MTDQDKLAIAVDALQFIATWGSEPNETPAGPVMLTAKGCVMVAQGALEDIEKESKKEDAA